MLIDRTIFQQIKKALQSEPKIIIIYGPRQAGKTTLLNQLVENIKQPFLALSGDNLQVQKAIQPDYNLLKNVIGDKKLVTIDEAQHIENIGLSLKIIYDQLHLPILVTGSFSFDLANKINEPLTGRTSTFHLYPLSFTESPQDQLEMDPKLKIEPYLRFGSYPKVITTTDTDLKRKYLDELVNNYLYHDLLEFRSIRKPKKIVDLLSLLALQIGSEVSINELSSNLDIERSSVEKYLDILEKMFVIVNLRGFSRNLRKEIYKTSKYYFVDLGVRNVLIQNFNSMNLRSDAGALFENFCIIERIKFINNNQKYANYYFWRTYNQKEIDLIEESESKLNAFEFKWSPRNEKISSAYNEFEKVYKNTTYNLITPTSFKSFSIKVEI